MPVAHVQRDGKASDFTSIIPLELVLLFNEEWCVEEQEVGHNGPQEFTSVKS